MCARLSQPNYDKEVMLMKLGRSLARFQQYVKDRLAPLNPTGPGSAAAASIKQRNLSPLRANTELISAGANLGLRLHRQMAHEGPRTNLVVSPVSLQLLLAMVVAGAGGTTREELTRLLAIDTSNANWETSYAELIQALQGRGVADALQLANAIWVSTQCELRAEFEMQCRELFDAEVVSLDFHSPEAIGRINAWVRQKTNGNISSIVDQLKELARMVLINCVYFNGKWSDPFEKVFTKELTFHAMTSDSRRPFMHQSGSFSYLENAEFQAIRLYYVEPQGMMMSVFLPKKQDGLEQFLQTLGQTPWQELSRGFASHSGQLALPRFHVECNLRMKGALQTLGMTKSFLPTEADFGGMLTNPMPLWIDDVLQKTYLDVNEEGTEAAAATAGVMEITAMLHSAPPKPFRMIVDHPFFATISDLRSGCLLFTASVWDV